MIVAYLIGLSVLLNLSVLCQSYSFGARIAFPESSEDDPTSKTAEFRNPVYIPDLCKEGEFLYSDHENNWVCDCKRAYIYYPTKERCYMAYSKGPCNPGHHLILPNNSVIPECVRNRCARDKFVYFRNGCYQLDTKGPCTASWSTVQMTVEKTTLDVICKEIIPSRFSEEDQFINGTRVASEPWECLIGGKRWSRESCE